MTEPKYLDAGSSGEWGWHATELALRCPQLFAYHHRVGRTGNGSGGRSALAGTERPPLLRGSLVHQGLAHHYARKQAEQAGRDPNEWADPFDAIEECARRLTAKGEGDASKYVESSSNIVADYIAHYVSEKLEVLHVEEVFTADIEGRKFTQRFDLVARRQNGKIYIFDHKTTGRISAELGARYALSGQFLGMANFGQQVFGTDFGGVVINIIGCGPADGYSALGSSKFERQEPPPAPHAQKLFTFSVLHARERIEALDASGLDPWKWPKVLSEQACVTAYGKCDGFELCRWGQP